ncbi:type IV secretory system conjugative DNA transfer family protein [Mediterraneibacter glycyrrhizinilyticus]|nr:type IV secretory system conjugative DNA transfer family protein [Mediterraneibacter glycyrrhizinilyticus]MBM6802152.1 type IV secretory system conjugative DNA transfer family protein [Mediterraneibacter glycyrrhizinilyticus]
MKLFNRKIKENVTDPLKDKGRVMKLEYLLSNNYTIIAVVVIVDILVVLAIALVLGMISSLPGILSGVTDAGKLISVKSIVSVLSGITVGGAAVGLLLLAVIDVFLVYKIKVSWSDKAINVGQRGTDRFTTEDEIKDQYTAIEPLFTPYKGDPGILISRIGNTFYIDQMVVNNLLIGITRSGKGETEVKTSIEIYSRAENQPSLIVNDQKIELYKTFAPILRERGYKVYLLNASNPLLSMGFNLIGLAVQYYKKKDYDTAEQVTNSLAHSFFNVDEAVGDMVFFTASASALFSAMCLAAMQDAFEADERENNTRYERWKKLDEESRKAHPFRYRNDNEKTVNLYSMIVNFGQLVSRPVNKDGSRTLLDVYFESRPDNDRARLKYLNTEVAPGKTKSSIFSEMLRNLESFTLRNVGRMTAESTIEFSEIGFGKQPVAIFLATPSYDTYLHKIPTIFIRQMYFALGKICDDHKGKCDRQVKVIFDEAGNMPPVDLMDTMTTMGLGQNISFDLYLQNYEQLDNLYGKDMARTISGNCGNHFYLQTSSEDTAELFSHMLGNRSVIDVQRAGGKLGLNKYYTESVIERPLLLPNELMQLQEGEIAIFRRSKRRDRAGNSIRPLPIFNSRENGHYLWYFYQYAPEDKFPNPNEVSLIDVCTDSRKQINLEERIWDIRKSFRLLGVQVNLPESRQTKQGAVKKTLQETGKYSVISQMLRRTLGDHFEEEYGITGDTTLAEYVSFISSQDINETEKEVLLEAI